MRIAREVPLRLRASGTTSSDAGSRADLPTRVPPGLQGLSLHRRRPMAIKKATGCFP